MEINAKSADRNQLQEQSGELDHHGARNALREIELAIDASLPRMLMLDLAGVTFMDSSGIGLLMGRFKLMRALGGTVYIANAGERIRKVLMLSGIHKIIPMEGI